MNFWYAGPADRAAASPPRQRAGRRFAGRLLQQMPVIVAFGMNLGIVPLLFVQLAYYKVFYPATILMACFWLGIIVLLIPAYYGVYAYAWASLSREWRRKRIAPSEWAARCRRLVRGVVLRLHRLHLRQRPEPDGARAALAGALERPQHRRGGDGHGLEPRRSDPASPLVADVRPGAGHDGRLGAGRCGLSHPRYDRRGLPGLGVGIRPQALHVRNALGGGGGLVVRVPRLAGQSARHDVPLAVDPANGRHGRRPWPALAADDDRRAVFGKAGTGDCPNFRLSENGTVPSGSAPSSPPLPCLNSACSASMP